MANAINTIGVLTSGGDAPGMNAAIRAVVREAIYKGMKVYGIRRGYAGVLDSDFVEMNTHSVSEIVQKGGTILETARCLEFHQEQYQTKGARNLHEAGIEGLVVIGGDGSFRGAQALSMHGINVAGVPGTIDLDIGFNQTYDERVTPEACLYAFVNSIVEQCDCEKVRFLIDGSDTVRFRGQINLEQLFTRDVRLLDYDDLAETEQE